MSLDELFMPAIRIDGARVRRVEQLGEWPARPPKMSPEQLRARARERNQRYRLEKPEIRARYNAKRRAERKAK